MDSFRQAHRTDCNVRSLATQSVEIPDSKSSFVSTIRIRGISFQDLFRHEKTSLALRKFVTNIPISRPSKRKALRFACSEQKDLRAGTLFKI